MITEERMMELLARANPEPDKDFELDSTATAYLATLEQRSSEVTQLDTKTKGTKGNQKRNTLTFLAAAVVVIAVVIGLAVWTQRDQIPVGVQPSPEQTLEGYIAAYNAGDLDEVMTYFSDESVITGHPFAESAKGISEIRTVQRRDLNAAASEDAYTISNVQVSGNTVTWDHVWVNDLGVTYCQNGQEAVIEDGKFVTWTWPGSESDCS